MLSLERPRAQAPLHVQIEVTWRCNWRCVHCYQDDHTREVLTLARLRALAGELASLGTLEVILTGGEPLVRHDLMQVLDAFRERRVAITLYSNGHLISRDVARALSSRVARVELTLLGGDAATHDALAKVRGAFARTVAAIEHLRDSGVHVVAKTPVLRPALATFSALAERLGRLGVEWIVDTEIARSYAGSERSRALALDGAELARFYREHPQFAGSPRAADAGAPRGTCLAAKQFCFIDALGNVYPCLSFKSGCDARHIPVGNVTQGSFAEAWAAVPLMQAVRAASAADFTACSSCEAPSCRSCMATSFEAHGGLFTPSDEVCEASIAKAAALGRAFVPASRLLRRAAAARRSGVSAGA